MRFSPLHFAGLALVPFLAACGSNQGAWGDYAQLIRQSFSGAFRKTAISREQAAAIPYASLGYRVNGSNEALLVLATDTNGDMLWTASSHIVLMTRDGRIVRTIGLPHDVAGTTAKGTERVPPLSDALRAPYRSIRALDLPDIGVYGMALSCVTTAKGPQTISIIGAAIRTTRIDEACRSTQQRWSFTDSYWIDPSSGFVWHSIQHVHPSGTTIQTEIFRPPG